MGKKLKIETEVASGNEVRTFEETVKLFGIHHLGQGKYSLVEADVPLSSAKLFGDMTKPKALDQFEAAPIWWTPSM